jgi:hypothetical protein
MGLRTVRGVRPELVEGCAANRMINAVNRNPVIERIVPTASPINFANNANACEVDDSMEKRSLFPVTRSRFRLLAVSDDRIPVTQAFLPSRSDRTVDFGGRHNAVSQDRKRTQDQTDQSSVMGNAGRGSLVL